MTDSRYGAPDPGAPDPDAPLRDEFLSEEDLDLRNLSDEELIAYWNQWLLQASATDEEDKYQYSHGCWVGMEEPH